MVSNMETVNFSMATFTWVLYQKFGQKFDVAWLLCFVFCLDMLLP